MSMNCNSASNSTDYMQQFRDVVLVLNIPVSRHFLEHLSLISVLMVEHLGLERLPKCNVSTLNLEDIMYRSQVMGFS